jgi:hypothetical protein
MREKLIRILQQEGSREPRRIEGERARLVLVLTDDVNFGVAKPIYCKKIQKCY